MKNSYIFVCLCGNLENGITASAAIYQNTNRGIYRQFLNKLIMSFVKISV